MEQKQVAKGQKTEKYLKVKTDKMLFNNLKAEC